MKNMKNKFKKFEIIYIKWLDSFSSENSWMDASLYDFKEHNELASFMETIGFIINIDKKHLYLSNSINKKADCCFGIFSIPISAISVIKKVKL